VAAGVVTTGAVFDATGAGGAWPQPARVTTIAAAAIGTATRIGLIASSLSYPDAPPHRNLTGRGFGEVPEG
jgi:hypothetical protein